ncbi:MAG: hypothetical protein AAF318_15830 [Pseudomonadota bacterium]
MKLAGWIAQWAFAPILLGRRPEGSSGPAFLLVLGGLFALSLGLVAFG